MQGNYRPTYLYLENSTLPGNWIYFDTLIVKYNETVFAYAAYGDGAHVNLVSTISLTSKALRADDFPWHIDQLANYIYKADAVVAIRNHKVVYQKGE